MGQTAVYQGLKGKSFALFECGKSVASIADSSLLSPLPSIATLYRWHQEWESERIGRITKETRFSDDETSQKVVGDLVWWLRNKHGWTMRKSNSKQHCKWYFGPPEEPRRFYFCYCSMHREEISPFSLSGGSFYDCEDVYRGVAARLGCEICIPVKKPDGLASFTPISEELRTLRGDRPINQG